MLPHLSFVFHPPLTSGKLILCHLQRNFNLAKGLRFNLIKQFSNLHFDEKRGANVSLLYALRESSPEGTGVYLVPYPAQLFSILPLEALLLLFFVV